MLRYVSEPHGKVIDLVPRWRRPFPETRSQSLWFASYMTAVFVAVIFFGRGDVLAGLLSGGVVWLVAFLLSEANRRRSQ